MSLENDRSLKYNINHYRKRSMEEEERSVNYHETSDVEGVLRVGVPCV